MYSESQKFLSEGTVGISAITSGESMIYAVLGVSILGSLNTITKKE